MLYLWRLNGLCVLLRHHVRVRFHRVDVAMLVRFVHAIRQVLAYRRARMCVDRVCIKKIRVVKIATRIRTGKKKQII